MHAFINPNLNTNLTISGISLSEAIVDVCSESLQGNGSLTVELTSCDVCTAKTSCASCLDTKGASLHGAGHALLNGTSVGYAVLKLLSNVLCNQLRISVRSLDLLDVNLYLLAGHLCQLGLGCLDVCAAASDDQAGLCGVDHYLYSVGRSLDLNLCNARVLQLCLQVLSDLVVLCKIISKLRLSIPSGIPIFNNTDS